MDRRSPCSKTVPSTSSIRLCARRTDSFDPYFEASSSIAAVSARLASAICSWLRWCVLNHVRNDHQMKPNAPVCMSVGRFSAVIICTVASPFAGLFSRNQIKQLAHNQTKQRANTLQHDAHDAHEVVGRPLAALDIRHVSPYGERQQGRHDGQHHKFDPAPNARRRC